MSIYPDWLGVNIGTGENTVEYLDRYISDLSLELNLSSFRFLFKNKIPIKEFTIEDGDVDITPLKTNIILAEDASVEFFAIKV